VRRQEATNLEGTLGYYITVITSELEGEEEYTSRLFSWNLGDKGCVI
jgi:hypothetical protein